MGVELEWLKQAVSLCMMTTEQQEPEKKEGFQALEQRFLDFSEIEKEQIRNLLKTQFEVRDGMYMLSNFIRYMKIQGFEDDILELMIQGEFDCYLGSMFELQAQCLIKDNYEKRQKLHRTNIQKYEDEIDINETYQPLEQRNKKRIAIITEQILEIQHAPTQVVLNMAYILQKCLGYEILLFVCPTDRGIEPEIWHKPVVMTSNDFFRSYSMRLEYKDTYFDGYQINMEPGCQKEYSMMFAILHAWNPYFVFSVGMINPVADLARNFTTLVAMDVSTGCPISEADILIRLSRLSESKEEYYKTLLKDQKQIFMEKTMPTLLEAEKEAYSRTRLGLPEDKFLIAIVGNRLDAEVDTEFINICKKILELRSQVSFVVIGKNPIAQEKLNDPIFTKRLFYLGYCEELMKTIGCLDLYLNPKRMGGGYSSVYALVEEIPVVTLPDCDVAYNVGEEFTVQNYQKMIETVCRYVDDKKFYQKKQKSAITVAANSSKENLKAYMCTMLEKIRNVMEG